MTSIHDIRFRQDRLEVNRTHQPDHLDAKQIHRLIVEYRNSIGGDVGDNHIRAVRQIEREYLQQKNKQ